MTFFFSLYIVADCDHSAAVDAAETRVYSSSVPDGFPRLTSWGGQYIYCQPAFWFIGALVYLMMPDFLKKKIIISAPAKSLYLCVHSVPL